MVDLTDVQRLAATLPDVTEGERHDHRTWAVAGKVFAWERPFSKADIRRFAREPVPQGPILALITDGLEDKEALLQAHPEHLFTIPHLDNYAAVLLHLDNSEEADLRAALEDAWLVHAPADVAERYLERRETSERRAMSELVGIARFTFHEGKVEEFKRLSGQCLEIVRTQDTGTLQYDIYVNDDESEAIVIERYADSDALVEHLAHIGDDLMQAIMTTASVHGETLGNPSAELRARMDGSPVQLFTPFLSL
ncbi:MAG: antibiotic biosynthesis monooxygenase [Cellulomonas sp.]